MTSSFLLALSKSFEVLCKCIPALNSLQGFFFTCNKGVLDTKPEAFELFVAAELDPHEAARREHQAGVLASTEAVDERREPERTVADFYVIEAALK